MFQGLTWCPFTLWLNLKQKNLKRTNLFINISLLTHLAFITKNGERSCGKKYLELCHDMKVQNKYPSQHQESKETLDYDVSTLSSRLYIHSWSRVIALNYLGKEGAFPFVAFPLASRGEAPILRLQVLQLAF